MERLSEKMHFVLSVTVALCTPAFGQTVISTVAGSGSGGLSGDDGPATAAELNFPFGVFVDSGGNLFIADFNNHVVRKVDSNGTITTVAGTGAAGLSGDDGVATAAQLNFPTGVFVDSGGNLFIADQTNHSVRKVDSGGTITTVAGTGAAGFSGDNGAATGAQLNNPVGVFVDATGNLFIADATNNRVRKVAGGTITTVAGTGAAGFSGDDGAATAAELDAPVGVSGDAAGNLFIADRSNQRIRKVDSGGTITTVAGNGGAGFSGDGGAATAAQINEPNGVFADSEGNLFIADKNNDRVRLVNAAGTITTVAGTGVAGFSGDAGPATSAQLDTPAGVAIDAVGNLFIADEVNHRIRKVALAAPTLTVFSGVTLPTTAPTLDWSDVTGATSYTLQYASDAAFTVNDVTVAGLAVSEYTFSTPLADGTYFWHVRALGSESDYSATDSFAIIPTFTQGAVILLALAMAGYMWWRLR